MVSTVQSQLRTILRHWGRGIYRDSVYPLLDDLSLGVMYLIMVSFVQGTRHIFELIRGVFKDMTVPISPAS